MSTGLPASPASRPPPLPASIRPPALPASVSPAPAVEVVTSLGGSVVSIDTLATPSTRPGRGRALLALGAALLAGAAITFGVGVLDARHDAAAREQWRAEGRPAWAFRPIRHGHAADLAALGGALAGLGLIATGLLRKRERARTSLRIGGGGDVDVPVAGAPELTVVTGDGHGGFVANLTGLTGEVCEGATSASIAELVASGRITVPLTTATRVRAALGPVTLHLSGITAPVRSAPPVVFASERRTLAFVAASAIAHLGLLAVLRTVPPDASRATADFDEYEESSTLVRLTSSDDAPPDEIDPGDAEDTGDQGGATSRLVSMAIDVGTAGTPKGVSTPGKLQVKNRDRDPDLARAQAIEEAARSGILGSTFLAGPLAVAGGPDIASGFDDLDITGAILDGGGSGAPIGSFGYGVRGFGVGCGRPDGQPCDGTIDSHFATIGWRADRDYVGPLGPRGPGRTRGHDPRPPTVTISHPVTCTEDAPCLDESIIRRYVRRNLEKITYCYEKELLAKPGLEGTVVARFTLNGSGRVIESSASGVDPAVSGCIAGVVSNIKFPRVGDSGIYPIKYPFILHARGR